MATINEGQQIFKDEVVFQKSVTLPAATIAKDAIKPGTGIKESDVEHRYQPTFRQPNTNATAETVVIHQVFGATGEVLAFRVGSQAKATGDSTVTVDLQKSTGGAAFVSLLTAPIVLNNANADRVAVAATIVVSGVEDLVAGDLIRIVQTISAGSGTLPTGVFATPLIKESP